MAMHAAKEIAWEVAVAIAVFVIAVLHYRVGD